MSGGLSRATRRAVAIASAAVLVVATIALAQRGYDPRSTQEPYTIANVPYDGRFTFARIRFESAGGGGFRGRYDLKWDHDFPRAERNFMQILTELSDLRPYMGGGNVFALDDPELLKFPLAYLCEPGFWAPTDAEALALRNYLAKGGFIIFDDFYGPGHWHTFETAMRKVLPQGRLVLLDATHPIFDSFFRIETLEMGEDRRGAPEFWGIYEDNDPARRLIAIANFNNDLGENWEYSDTGMIPVDQSNEAYKLGINYLMYAMTH